jgi:uncharacterized membrane protein YeaQ/YmgE (transglycosylase-associated protein family)
MLGLTVLLVIWIIMGLIIGNYASGIFKSERPYGLGGDVIISLITTVLVGVMGWYVAKTYMPGFTGIPLLLGQLIEPPVSALIVLWLIRYFKK